MKVVNLGLTNSVLGTYVAQMRDKAIQKDRLRFRNNLQRVGRVFAYEISKALRYSVKQVETPEDLLDGNYFVVATPDDAIVVASILRAGLPIHNGILDVFEGAESAFIAAYRKYDRGEDFHITVEYLTAPGLDGKVLILADTMIASGVSIELTWGRLLEEGEPLHTHLVCPIASAYAVEYLQKRLPGDKVTLWTAAIDEELTLQSYIVPGLGDAGDLAFGEKHKL